MEKIDDVNFRVSVKELAEKSRANRAAIKALADYFGVVQADVQIVSGSTSRLKIIDIKKQNN